MMVVVPGLEHWLVEVGSHLTRQSSESSLADFSAGKITPTKTHLSTNRKSY